MLLNAIFSSEFNCNVENSKESPFKEFMFLVKFLNSRDNKNSLHTPIDLTNYLLEFKATIGILVIEEKVSKDLYKIFSKLLVIK